MEKIIKAEIERFQEHLRKVQFAKSKASPSSPLFAELSGKETVIFAAIQSLNKILNETRSFS